MLGRNRVSRETRTCANSNCDITFEVRIAAPRKFCCVSCITKDRKRSAEWKRNRSRNQKEQWQDPEYKRIQHAARVGKVGGWNRNLTKEIDPRIAAQAEKITGRIESEETKAKQSKALKGRSYIELYGEERAKEMIQIRSEAVKGEKSPWWQGGISENPYPEEFVRARKEAKTRDGYQCQLCEKLELDEKNELGRGLLVHHIDYDKQNCRPENLITLCCSCHGRTNVNREYWEMFFKDRLREYVLV